MGAACAGSGGQVAAVTAESLLIQASTRRATKPKRPRGAGDYFAAAGEVVGAAGLGAE